MKEYMLLFRGGVDYTTDSPEVLQQSMMKWMTWMDKLKADGIYFGGERLNRASAAVLSGPEKQLSDGPYAEGKEIVGGFIAIKANDLQEAIEVAKGCPIYDYQGSTEVQEIAKM